MVGVDFMAFNAAAAPYMPRRRRKDMVIGELP
jgi:hypothetical protein